MSTNNSNKPKLRFKRFSDDWEQRKVGDCFLSLQNNTLSRVELSDENGTVMNVHYGDVLTKFSECLDVSKDRLPFIKKQFFMDKFKTSYLKNGDVIVSDTAEDETVGKCIEIIGMTNQKVLSGLHTIPLRPKEQFATGYLGFYLNSSVYHRQLKPLMQGIKVTSISKSAMLDTVIKYPSDIWEQTLIGQYFMSLDNLITLHQRKCDDLKIIKKSMLDNLFPKIGEKVPKWRFKGFNNDWEQRKFSELCDMVTVGIANSATHAYSDSGIVMFRNQNIKPNFLDDNDIIHIKPEFESRYKNKRLKKNDLLVARTGYPGTACVVPEKYENSQTFTTLIARPKNSVNSYFLCQYLNSDIGVKYFESTQIGGGQKNSGAGILNEMPVMLPSGIEEESKIAEYFTNFDHLITLHQREVEQLKKAKQFFLEKMFI